MALRSARVLPFVFVSALVMVPVIACSASGDGAAVDDTPEPTPTSSLPPAGDSSTSNDDSGGMNPKDGGKMDSGKDAGPPPPNPGDACPTNDAKFTKPCGKCGQATALCLNHKVSDYGICEMESGQCTPGEQQACGKCGTSTCTNYCVWGACSGEKTGASACFAGQWDIDSAGCAASTWRTRNCKADCTFDSYSGCVADPTANFTLAVSGTVGQSASIIVPMRTTFSEKRITGSCTSSSVSATYTDPVTYVTLTNPTGQQVTASYWAAPPSSTSLVPRMLLAWYAAKPAMGDDASRKACSKGFTTSCPTALMTDCADSKAGMNLTNSVVIPAGGSVVLYGASYETTMNGSPGDAKLIVRTDSLL